MSTVMNANRDVQGWAFESFWLLRLSKTLSFYVAAWEDQPADE